MGGPWKSALSKIEPRWHLADVQVDERQGADPPELRRLVRGFLEQLEPGAVGGTRRTDREEGVVLDLVVDGFRCVVIRLSVETDAASHHLSPRESEIARMVAKGYPNKTIAAVLEISSWTVSTHLRRMFAKLGVTSRAAMVARLLEPSAGR